MVSTERGSGEYPAATELSGSGSSSSSSGDKTASSSTTPAAAAQWKPIERGLAGLAPEVGFLAARVSTDGRCEPVHAIAPSKPRPTASQFKLFVLGALARQIASGKIAWDQKLTVPESVKSLGNSPDSGALAFAPPGSSFTVEDVATNMISISDNTAADMLIRLVGRDAVEAQMRRWSAHASANHPFLLTREMFMLHYVKGLGDRYLATPRDRREAFLESSVDPLPLSSVAAGYSPDPRSVETIEWFASPADVCRALAGLQRLAKQPGLAPLSAVLSKESGKIGLDPPQWRTVFFKGGSEPGVLTLGWLATTKKGETYVVQAMLTNPDAALAADSITDLVGLGHESFEILGREGR
jgi:beta-lactamase class A